MDEKCKNCKYSCWELDAAGDEVQYFCRKDGTKLVEKDDHCEEWKGKDK